MLVHYSRKIGQVSKFLTIYINFVLHYVRLVCVYFCERSFERELEVSERERNENVFFQIFHYLMASLSVVLTILCVKFLYQQNQVLFLLSKTLST